MPLQLHREHPSSPEDRAYNVPDSDSSSFTPSTRVISPTCLASEAQVISTPTLAVPKGAVQTTEYIPTRTKFVVGNEPTPNVDGKVVNLPSRISFATSLAIEAWARKLRGEFLPTSKRHITSILATTAAVAQRAGGRSLTFYLVTLPLTRRSSRRGISTRLAGRCMPPSLRAYVRNPDGLVSHRWA